MNAEIVTIGDELLIGQVINTNASYIAEQLNSVGIFDDTMTTVGDDEASILKAFDHALSVHDVVVVTGGLGPTHDDITRAAVCKFFTTDLVVNAEAFENIKNRFANRNIALVRRNEEQALVPRGCTVIQNRHGTAPGYLFERHGKYFIVMPGVPAEMKGMMDEFVVPYFSKLGTGTSILHRTLKTTGIAESILADQIGDIGELLGTSTGASLAFLPGPTGVRLRITVRSSSRARAESTIRDVEQKIRAKAEQYIYGTDTEDIEAVVGRMLRERKMRLSVAESCTGGLIADRVTNVPGSSDYFERGMVTYSDESKRAELGVPESSLERFGAVSREVAEAMALGIRTASNTDIGVSTTGIAGPTGGSEEKPVGLVWIGYSDRHETVALRFNFPGDRRIFKERVSQAALELVRRKLLKQAS
ncbi:MAG TPA: competence/damage-inducible protein A [Bacteroidota bacterium]|nr:competence/damage-inducible protein A [Bacteroidota bacterium]